MEPYYYSKMSRPQQAAYHGMLQGLNQLAPEIQLPRLSAEELYDVFFRLRLDHPEIFWATGYKYRFYQDSPNLLFLPDYLFEKSKIREHQQAMRARIDKLIRPAKDLSESEKEQYIHDFICENVHYDKLKKPYSHEIIGPLGQGVGVCEGIAKTVKCLCDALGIWCMIALSGNNPEKGIKYRHTWNIVRIGKSYYHLDATFDNSLGRNYSHASNIASDSGNAGTTHGDIAQHPIPGNKNSGKKGSASTRIRYDYFNLDDKQIFRDHEPLIAPAPACTDSAHSYYKEKKLSFAKTEDVYRRALQAAKKEKPLTFHWKGGYLTRAVLDELLAQIAKAGTERQKMPCISLNWPQAVLHVEYVANPQQATIVMEQANEGEETDV